MAGIKSLIPVSLKDAIKVALSKNRCPVCNKKVLDFKPLGGKYLDGVEIHGKKYFADAYETIDINRYLCPLCQSNDRTRLYKLYFEKIKNQFGHSHKRLLHVSPDTPLFVDYIKSMPDVSYRSCDLLRTDVDDSGVDISNMPLYKDASFDIIICSHVLEHVPDDLAAVKELHRILKSGGWALIMVPILLPLKETFEDPSITSPEDRWKHYGQDDHVRMYSKKGFMDKLKQGGFKLQEVTTKDFPKGLFQISGVSEKSVLYICTK